MEILSILDLVLTPIYLAIIYFISRMIQKRRIEKYPEYKYYLSALTAKVLGALALCLMYTFYYSGGDTTQYFADSIMVNKLFFKDIRLGLEVIIGGLNRERMMYFDAEIGFPAYWREASTSFVVQIVSVLSIFGFRAFIPTSMLVAWFSFMGIWNLYRVFLAEFPKLGKEMAIVVFYVPSLLFWGSGIMKDTFTLSAVGYFTYSFYFGFIRHHNVFRNLVVVILSAYVIIIVKAYIFIALLPGALIWLSSSYLSRIKGKFIRFSAAPIFLIIATAGAIILINYMGSSLGKFSADQLLERAVVTQRDLKSAYYKGNSFDIGEFDSSFESILSVSHKAFIAGMFRPYLWEANNVPMLIAGIENLIFLWLFFRSLVYTRVFGLFVHMLRSPLITFSLIFSVFFAFSVGLSTSNFGSLVRYKIPAIPFFGASMIFIYYSAKESRAARKGELDSKESRVLVLQED